MKTPSIFTQIIDQAFDVIETIFHTKEKQKIQKTLYIRFFVEIPI